MTTPPTRHIYLDHGASTPVHPDVVAAMLPLWTEAFGNASSAHHHGRDAAFALENARRDIAGLLQAQVNEFIFTGCGSESDNLAIRGVLGAVRSQGQRCHLIISSIEHSAIIQTAVQLRGYDDVDLTILPVDGDGMVNPDDVQAAIQPHTRLISIMAANNEVGTLQPIEAIGTIAQAHGVLFHTDAVQSIATRRWHLSEMPIDLLSFAPHKFYGPKGVGVLYVREGVALMPSLTGGSQENGRRAGTENVAFAVGAAKALAIAQDTLPEAVAHYTSLREHLIEGMTAAFPETEVRLTGHRQQRLSHHASFAFNGLKGNDLLLHLDIAGISASSGSACKTGNPKPSVILEALGLGPAWTTGGLRLTVGRQNQIEDITYLLEKMPEIVAKVRQTSMLFA